MNLLRLKGGFYVPPTSPPAPPEGLGSELWPQPAFDASTGLTNPSGNWTVAAGVATSNGSSGSLIASGIIEIGKEYRATITVVSRTAGSVLFGWDGDADPNTGLYVSAPGTYTHSFIAQTTNIQLWSSSFAGSVDDYSIKEILSSGSSPAPPPPPPPPPPAPPPGISPIVNTVATDYTAWMNQFYPDRQYQHSNIEFQNKTIGCGARVWDQLSNNQIGATVGQMVSARFRARYSGYVTGARIYWIPNLSGSYSRGNGGTIRMRIFPDNGGVPNTSGTVYGQSIFVPNLNASQQIQGGDGNTHFQNHTFSQLAPLVAGTLYHVVWDNTHADTVNNYISTESANTRADNVNPDPVFIHLDWVTCRKNSAAASWFVFNSGYAFLQPMMQINQASGSYGFNQYGPGNYSPYIFTVTNAAPFRSRITPTSTRVWYGGVIALLTSTGGFIDWTLKDSGGTTLASGSFSQPSVNLANTAQEADTLKFTSWYPFWFGTGVLLSANSTYYLTYTPRGSSSWRTCVSGDGRQSNRFPAIANTEVTAQHWYNGAYIGAAGNSQTVNVEYGGWREFFRTA